MKKTIILCSLFLILFISGCTQTNEINDSQWSKEVSELGDPTYQKVVVSSGYEILPFPGLEYNGLRDNYQAFYAKNKDNNFAIYTSPSIINTEKSYEELKKELNEKYILYGKNVTCSDISTNTWLTQARAFKCTYYLDSINVEYKSVIFYKEKNYIETQIGVWGTSLGKYEFIFDEFNQKAVSWN